MVTSTKARRKLWREHYTAVQLALQEAGYDATFPPFPEELRGLTCGAKNRKGEPCRKTELYLNGRCKFHGGMSTGPTSDSGKKVALANLAKRHPKPSNPMDC